ncbi:TetR/AcrR family transcriptional regulator [Thermocrispum municipale]|uniref:TetR/AcrR family transcriptional regulator n=1 Tax=Thermocrispum municipale TaxID=37926 RepID=UPI00048FF02D|nr:TetR/AcrR family transcriptional regulator [Thermocrispum municipale]
MAVNSTHTRVRKAAVRLFAAKGYHGVGIRELAEAAKLSSASLYHYMGTKEELLADIMWDCLERLLSAAMLATTDVQDPQEKLGRLAALHAIAHAAQAKETAVVDNELRALSPKLRRRIIKQRDAYEGLWAEALDEGQQAGVFLPDEHGITRRALLEMCSGVARWYSPRGPLTLRELGSRYATLTLRAAGAGPNPPEPDMERCRTIVRYTWGTKV